MNNRYTFIWEEDKWVAAKFNEIKEGQIFKLHELDMTPVKDQYGNVAWKAVSDAYLNDEDVWTIDI